MNDKIQKELPIKTRKFFISSTIEGSLMAIFLPILIFIIYGSGLNFLIISLLYFIGQHFFIKYLYLKSATKLSSVDNILEVELPFQKPITIPLENISKIEKTGKWSKSIDYFVIEYDDKKINTYIMSSGLKENLYSFMEELQRRVDNAKSLASIKND